MNGTRKPRRGLGSAVPCWIGSGVFEKVLYDENALEEMGGAEMGRLACASWDHVARGSWNDKARLREWGGGSRRVETRRDLNRP